MLKISLKNKRSTSGLKLFYLDESVFRNPPTHLRVRRLIPLLSLDDNNRNRRHHAIMEEEKESNEDERYLIIVSIITRTKYYLRM